MNHQAWMPHGFCFLWDPAILWPLAVANLSIFVAYVAISATLVSIQSKKRSELFAGRSVSFMFAAFVIACGIGHAVKVATYWTPIYRAEVLIDGVTAIVSLSTAWVLWQFRRALAALPSREEVDRARKRAREAEENLQRVTRIIGEDARRAATDAAAHLVQLERTINAGS